MAQLEYHRLPSPPELFPARGNTGGSRLPNVNPPSVYPHPMPSMTDGSFELPFVRSVAPAYAPLMVPPLPRLLWPR